MNETEIQDLRAKFRGELITPTDATYDAARKVYNGMIDRHPRVIVQCTDVTDVMASVDFAREHGIALSVRGGSHSVPGFGTNDDGVVIDLLHMNGVRVDPHTKTARAEGGCTWSGLNHATYGFGLATPGGIIGSTGIGGLTLGGGTGYQVRSEGDFDAMTIVGLIE
jgi:FAD/FMN-containing dehydrogenase